MRVPCTLESVDCLSGQTVQCSLWTLHHRRALGRTKMEGRESLKYLVLCIAPFFLWILWVDLQPWKFWDIGCNYVLCSTNCGPSNKLRHHKILSQKIFSSFTTLLSYIYPLTVLCMWSNCVQNMRLTSLVQFKLLPLRGTLSVSCCLDVRMLTRWPSICRV